MDIHTQFKLVDALENRDIRIENIQFLPGCTSGDVFNDVVETLLADNRGEDLKRIIGGGGLFEALGNLIDGPNPYDEDEKFDDAGRFTQRELLGEYFTKYRYRTDWPTFLVQVATPVRDYSGRSGRGYGYSWGYYTTQWIAGQTLKDIMRHTVKWHRERVNAWKQKTVEAA